MGCNQAKPKRLNHSSNSPSKFDHCASQTCHASPPTYLHNLKIHLDDQSLENVETFKNFNLDNEPASPGSPCYKQMKLGNINGKSERNERNREIPLYFKEENCDDYQIFNAIKSKSRSQENSYQQSQYQKKQEIQLIQQKQRYQEICQLRREIHKSIKLSDIKQSSIIKRRLN